MNRAPRTRTHCCPTCSKRFIVFDDQWGYTQINKKNQRVKYFCRYSCMRKYEIPQLERINRKILHEHRVYGL